MKAPVLLAFACLCLFAKSSEALSCYCPEDGSACQQRKLTEVECPFGIILDHCECCRVCAKGPGEECGGPWDISGRCAKGFMCVPKPGDEEKYHFKGKCQRTVPTRPVGGAVDSGLDAEML